MTDQKKHLLADIYYWNDETSIYFGNDILELRFSMSSGNLIAGFDKIKHLQFIGRHGEEKPSILLRVGGVIRYPGVVRNSRVYALDGNLEIGHSTEFISYKSYALDRETVLEITVKEEDWLITSLIYLHPNSATFFRDLRVTYEGDGEVLLRDVRFMLPNIQVGPAGDTVLEAPDYPVTSHFPMNDIPNGVWAGLDSRTFSEPGKVQHSVDAPGSVVGLVAMHNRHNEFSVMCWPHSTSEFSIMEVEKNNDQIDLVQWLFLADRFDRGFCLQAGRQYLRLEHGDWNQVMHRFQEWYEDIGLVVPEDRPEQVSGTAIYEVHIGRAPFLNGIEYEPYPTMGDLLNDLPRIADMGFEVVQIMPHWPFCGYTVHDYLQIEKQYGNRDELIAVVKLAHDLGMKVILDVVLHGCVDKEIIRWDMASFGSHYDFIFKEWLALADEHSRYRLENPDWFMQDENEDTAKIYTWAFDLANQAFQEFIVGLLKHYITDLGVDGFRFDAPTWNCMPNWKRGLPYRASASYYGAYHLLNLIRKEIKEFAAETLLYTEPSGPLFRHSMDLTYNYDTEWLSGSLLKAVSERGFAGANIYTQEQITAKQAALWLHYHQLTLPRNSITVQHLDSHDTFWWGEMAQFRYEAFGLKGASALFAMFALLDGGIMVYAGAEKGAEDFYKHLIRLRQSNPILRYGRCETIAVTCDDEMVFPLLRSYHQDHLIPVINLNEDDIESVLHVPIDRFGLYDHTEVLVYDVFNNMLLEPQASRRITVFDLENLPIKISGYGLRILKVIPIAKS